MSFLNQLSDDLQAEYPPIIRIDSVFLYFSVVKKILRMFLKSLFPLSILVCFSVAVMLSRKG
jgi:hypothetical protein